MKVRAIDSTNDWTFGKGRNNYKSGIDAVAQNIKTRLQSFLADCFFDMSAGLDWFNINSSKDLEAAKISIITLLLNTEDVIKVEEIAVSLGSNRIMLITYDVNTSYGRLSGEVGGEDA